MKKIFFPLFSLILCMTSYCRTPRERVAKIGVQEGWQDDTRYVVVGFGSQNYNNEPAKVATAEACRIAVEHVQKRFSEVILGGDTQSRCAGVDPAADSYCDWEFRLDPSIFTFKGTELKRRNDFSSLAAFCEIALEYRHPDLRGKTAEYAARFNIVQNPEIK